MSTVLLPFPDDTDPDQARGVCDVLESQIDGHRFYALIGTSLTAPVVIL